MGDVGFAVLESISEEAETRCGRETPCRGRFVHVAIARRAGHGGRTKRLQMYLQPFIFNRIGSKVNFSTRKIPMVER